MKNLCIALVVMLLALPSYGQHSAASSYVQLSPEPLAIAKGKTTNLIYPYAITSVDRGSGDVLVQKAKGLEHILQVKAAVECFEPTNLTVITGDGTLYSYTVSYDEATIQLNLDYAGGHLREGLGYNEGQIKAMSHVAFAGRGNIAGVRDKNSGVKLAVESLLVKEGLFFFRITIRNSTPINYEVSQFRLFIKDQKKARRTASQENEIEQLYVDNPLRTVRANSEQTLVVVVPKFTIPDKRVMILQAMEKDGGRHLEAAVKNNVIRNAKPLPYNGLN